MANKSNGLSPSTKLTPIDKEYIKALIDEAMEKLSQDVKNDLDSTKVELNTNKVSKAAPALLPNVMIINITIKLTGKPSFNIFIALNPLSLILGKKYPHIKNEKSIVIFIQNKPVALSTGV